jgi:hypothetical protein
MKHLPFALSLLFISPKSFTMLHKIKCLFILPLILLCSYGQAQTIVWAKKAKDALTDTKRLIVLQLDSTDIPNIKKYKKRKDLIGAYAKYTRTFNEMIKTPILTHWHLCKQVDFMSVKDYLAFRKQASAKDKKETLVLLFGYPEYQFMNALEKLPSAVLENIDFEKVTTNGDYIQPIVLFDLETVRSSIDGKEVAAAPTLALASMDINRWYLNASDIAFAVENMQMSMQATADQGNAFLFCINFSNTDKGKLMGKTLLIPEEYTIKMSTGKKTITEAEIKKNYPWSWRFATYKEINEARAKGCKHCCVIQQFTPYCE